jgi:hypothetical protein
MATLLLTRPPDIILGDFGRFLAVRTAGGDYRVADTAEKLGRSFLHQETGADLLPWPASAAEDGLDCSKPDRCLYEARGKRVALVTAASGVPTDCSYDAIVAQMPAGFRCRGRIPVVDRIDSWRQGAIALWLATDGIAAESANLSRGDRPWVPHPISRRERALQHEARAATSE